MKKSTKPTKASREYQEAVKGIQKGLRDIQLGRTQSAKQAFAEIRAKHQVPSRKSTQARR